MQALKHLLRVGLLIALALIASAISSSAAVYAQGGGQNPTIYKGLGPFVFKGDLRRLPKANLSRRTKFSPLSLRLCCWVARPVGHAIL